MRGPGMRLELDMRRTWTCPACGNAQKLGWQATSLRCPCQPGGVPMRLTQDVRPRRTFVIPEFVPIPEPDDVPEPVAPAPTSASVSAEVTAEVITKEVVTTEVLSIEVETPAATTPVNHDPPAAPRAPAAPVIEPNEIDWPEEA